MRDLLFTYPCQRIRYKIFCWLRDEFEYADHKFGIDKDQNEGNEVGDRWMREGGIAPGSEWQRQIMQYWDRANTLGLDNPLGRQAMMKSAMTLLGFLHCMYRVHGEPPKPGVPSGEIR